MAVEEFVHRQCDFQSSLIAAWLVPRQKENRKRIFQRYASRDIESRMKLSDHWSNAVLEVSQLIRKEKEDRKKVLLDEFMHTRVNERKNSL